MYEVRFVAREKNLIVFIVILMDVLNKVDSFLSRNGFFCFLFMTSSKKFRFVVTKCANVLITKKNIMHLNEALVHLST